jgi:hypothetical protein
MRAERRNVQGTVRIHDFGDEVHLWFEQRVPWPIALEILRELKAPGPTPDATRLFPVACIRDGGLPRRGRRSARKRGRPRKRRAMPDTR